MEPSLLEGAFDAPEYVKDDVQQEVEEEELNEDTYGLLYAGYLTDVVKIGPHEIRIRTLKIGEELTAAILANRYKDTIEEGRALATALVAAAIVSVDGSALQGNLLGPKDDSIEARFDYILENWYWEVIRQVWEEYNKLLTRVRDSAEDLKKG